MAQCCGFAVGGVLLFDEQLIPGVWELRQEEDRQAWCFDPWSWRRSEAPESMCDVLGSWMCWDWLSRKVVRIWGWCSSGHSWTSWRPPRQWQFQSLMWWYFHCQLGRIWDRLAKKCQQETGWIRLVCERFSFFLFRKFPLFLFYVYRHFTCMSVCASHTCSAYGGQKRALDSLGPGITNGVLAVMWVLGIEPRQCS